MIPNVILNTTFSAKNIASAASVYQWTVGATGTYRIQVRVSGVVGNGDYVAYLKLNAGGVLASEPMLPKTTMTAGSGETAFWFSTITIDAMQNDVIDVMVDGLAADTSVSGNIRIFADASLDAVAMPVNGSGLTAIGDTRLENISSIKAKTDLIPSQPAAIGSAMVVSDKTGFSLAVAPPTKEEISTKVWSETIRSLTDKAGFSLSPIGAIDWSETFLDLLSNPIQDVLVCAYSDSDRTTLVTSDETDVNGLVTLYFQTAGTYYFRATKTGKVNDEWSEAIS